MAAAQPASLERSQARRKKPATMTSFPSGAESGVESLSFWTRSFTPPRLASATPAPPARARGLTRSLIFGRDERAREVLRVEGLQVFERLADPDQLDRQPELVGDRHG